MANIAQDIKDALDQLIAQTVSNAGAGGGGGGNKDVKMNPPKVFGGKPDDTTRFIYQVKNYIDGNAGQFTTDTRKILFTASYMTEGGADEWARTKIEEYRSPGHSFPTFDVFLKDLTDSFVPPNEKQRAYQLLQRTRLSDIPGKTVAGLNARFRTLVVKAGMSLTNDAITELYKKALPKEILKEILRRDPIPATLEAWFKEALRLDNADREAEDITSGRKIHFGTNTATHVERDPDAMDIDAIDTQGVNKPNSAPKTCYNCGGKGHIRRTCPSPPQTNAGGPSGGTPRGTPFGRGRGTGGQLRGRGGGGQSNWRAQNIRTTETTEDLFSAEAVEETIQANETPRILAHIRALVSGLAEEDLDQVKDIMKGF